MKTLVVTFSLLLCAFTFGTIEVPDAVKEAFKKKFPDVKQVKWEKENNVDYEASFKLNDKKVSALYSKEGAFKELETEVAVSEIPTAVTDAVEKFHPGSSIIEASRIDLPDNSLLYELELKTNSKEKEFRFDENGNPVKEQGRKNDQGVIQLQK